LAPVTNALAYFGHFCSDEEIFYNIDTSWFKAQTIFLPLLKEKQKQKFHYSVFANFDKKNWLADDSVTGSPKMLMHPDSELKV